ncbi:MAG: ribbon-helix-helix domain-containing protein [Micavibrio aeruginosavorus]|nr:ribbon-helix-helix domain-containing protein [Micavibrio aeruginosavorus]
MKKHSVRIAGHATSITLEDPFWEALRAIAAERGQPLNDLIEDIDNKRGSDNLSSAIRVFVLKHSKGG